MKKAEKSLKNTLKNAVLLVLAVLLVAGVAVSWDLSLAAGGAKPLAAPLAWLQSVWPLGDGGYVQRAGESAAAYPTRIAVTTPSGLVGAAYQEAAVGTLYETVRPLWSGALAQAKAFEAAQEHAFRTALAGDVMFLEYAGRVPVSLLAGWLGGAVLEEGGPSAGTLVLTKSGELFVRDAADGKLYAAKTKVDGSAWDAAAKTVSASACAFAGTLPGESYQMLRPETLVPQEPLAYPIYTARAPSYWQTDSQESLQRLLEAFHYDRDLQSYAEEDGQTQVFVGDASSLRVSQDGTVRYKTTSMSSGLVAYQAEEAEGMNAVAAQVDFAQALLSAALRSVDANSASAMLRDMEYDTAQGTCALTFARSLGGVPVEGSTLAQFTFRGGLLVSAELHLRVYTPTGETLYVLPAAQAAAAAPSGERRYVVAYRAADDGRMLARVYLE